MPPEEHSADQTTSTREIVAGILAPVVGDFVTKVSIRMASKKIGKTPDSLAPEDLPELATALRPALATLLGTPIADMLVERIRESAP